MDFEVPNFETWPGVDAIQLGHDVLGPGPRVSSCTATIAAINSLDLS